MQRRFRLMSLAIALSLTAGLQAAQNTAQNTGQYDMSVGTWKLDVAKSHFSGEPGPQSETVTIQAGGAVSVEEVGNDGKPITWSYTATEGQTVPITGMQNSTVMTKRINDRVFEHTWSMGGATYHGRGVVSKDGKTMRYTLDGTNKEGKKVHNVMVLEKQ